VITLGASSDSEEIFGDALTAFEPVITKGGNPSVRAAAVESLAIMCFVAADGPEETVQIMNIFTKAFSNGKPEHLFLPPCIDARKFRVVIYTSWRFIIIIILLQDLLLSKWQLLKAGLFFSQPSQLGSSEAQDLLRAI